jgi:hypothetical protein
VIRPPSDAHVIEWRESPSSDVLLVCRRCGILNVVPNRVAGHVIRRHRVVNVPGFRA